MLSLFVEARSKGHQIAIVSGSISFYYLLYLGFKTYQPDNSFEAELEANNISLSKDMKIGLTAGASTMKSELETLKTLLSNKIKEL